MAYARVIRLEKSDFDALVFKVALGLRKVQRSMIWRSMPVSCQSTLL